MNQKYPVKLSEAERSQLRQLISSGTAPARKLCRAQILLKSDSSTDGANWNYQAICEAFDVSDVTVRKDVANDAAAKLKEAGAEVVVL